MLGFNKTRDWVYPQSIQGRFMTLRRWTFFGLHVILFVTPWITVGGHPLVRFDWPARRFYMVGQIYTASDTLLLLFVLLFMAFALFFFTSLFGRVWCGYACPQTVFLETWIRPLELWIEGDRTRRKRRDAAGFSPDLVWRKAAKWTAFLTVSFLLAMSMVSFFAGARPLWAGGAGSYAYAFVAILTAAWFWDFTWFREQFCNYLCPYARFQSALTDDETLLIQYDPARGEPREKGKAAALDGRCIDCQKCVVVCPQGIDIRDGFQLECIQCARCVDACTSVMGPLSHETLVAYGSIAESEGRRVRRLRPRTLVYGGLLASLVVFGGLVAASRVPFEASVNRAPGSLFTIDADGYVRNTYVLKLTSNDPSPDPVTYEVVVEGLDDAEVTIPAIELASTGTRMVPLVVRVRTSLELARTTPILVHITARGGVLTIPTTFKSGAHVDVANGN